MFRNRLGMLGLAIGLGLFSGCSFCFSTNELFHRRHAQETKDCAECEGMSGEGPALEGMTGPMLPPNPGCVPVPPGSTPQLAPAPMGPAPRLVPEAAPQPYNPTR
jgi:hypothetical protein